MLVEHKSRLHIDHIVVAASEDSDLLEPCTRGWARRNCEIRHVPRYIFEDKHLSAGEVPDELGKVGQRREVKSTECDEGVVEEARGRCLWQTPMGRTKC